MNYGDWIDLAVGIAILLVISVLWYLHDKERTRIDRLRNNSVGEKYMQLMAAFMKQDGARLLDMSTNSADMKISQEGKEEYFSIYQDDKGVKIEWSLTEESRELKKTFEFVDDETQEEIMQEIASGILDEKSSH